MKGSKVGKLEVVPAEQAVIETFFDMRKEGRSWRELSDWANANGVMPRSAKKWSRNSVANIVKGIIRAEKRRKELAERQLKVEGYLK